MPGDRQPVALETLYRKFSYSSRWKQQLDERIVSEFSWELLPKPLLRSLKTALELTGDPAAALRKEFGARPGDEFVKIAWPSGKLANSDPPKQIAYRGSPPDAIEAATILRHGGYYYLIVSLDSCCQGSASTYNMGMGRSKNVAGPYVGKSGHPLLDDGTSPLLATVGHEVGPGGESYSNGYLAWHFYDANVGGATTLAIQKLGWTKDGWPSLAQN